MLTLQQFHLPALEYPDICNLEKFLRNACMTITRENMLDYFLNKMNAEKNHTAPESQEKKEKIAVWKHFELTTWKNEKL